MKKQPLKFYLPAEDVQWLREHAEAQERTITAILTRAVRLYREESEKPEAAAA